MEYRMIYITTKDKEQALSIGRDIVQNRLAACANIMDKMNSIYWWNQELEESQETILILKTISANVDSIIERVKLLHTYSCPCVISWKIEEGNPDYLDWISKEISKS